MLNIQGCIIGIKIAGISASEQGRFPGVGFAIPSNTHRNGYILNLKTMLAARPSSSLYPSTLPTQSPP
ncbi:MAG TPA: hypothetical protein VJ729_18770 [Nitrososphaeraceae archaeon]|nr:hypothetical protein [Nitrososphaeraceae archaeon]